MFLPQYLRRRGTSLIAIAWLVAVYGFEKVLRGCNGGVLAVESALVGPVVTSVFWPDPAFEQVDEQGFE